MFVSVTTIQIPDQDVVSKMEEGFEKHVPDLEKIEGFISFELWKQEGQVKSVVHWDSKAAFDRYIKSDMFKEHHQGRKESKLKAHLDYYEAKGF